MLKVTNKDNLLLSFPAPLNNTNLTGSVYLSKILSFSYFYFHNYQKSFSYSLSKSHYSTFDSIGSTGEWFNLVVDSLVQFVENLNKGFDMRTRDYKGKLTIVDSTEFNKFQQNPESFNSSKGLDFDIQVNLTGWARANSNGLRKIKSFLNRYKKEAQITKSRLLKESTKLVLFLIIEAAILKFSHEFYLKMGLTIIWAWSFAFMIEAAYTILSSESKLELRVLRAALFLFSAFTVCYSSFINDSALQKNLKWRDEKVLNQSAQIQALENMRSRKLGQRSLARKSTHQKIETINLQVKQLESRMDYYKRVGDESSLKVLSIEKYKKLNKKAELQSFKTSGISRKISSLDSKIEASRLKLEGLKSKHSQSKILSWSNFKALELNTYVWMSLMLILQLVSSCFIKSICLTVVAYINQKNKIKKKTEKRNFNGYSSPYFNVQ